MSRALIWLLLALATALGWWLRGSGAAVVDPIGAREMRTIELALATGRAPARDVWLDPDDVSDRTTMHARVIAAIAQRALARPDGDRALRGVGETDLERLARAITRVLGALGVPMIACAAMALGARARWAAALAASAFACLPSARTALVDPASLALLCGLGSLALLAFASRARELVDTAMLALLGGAVGGVAIACERGAAVHAVAALAAALWLSFDPSRAVASRAAAAGSAYALALATVTMLEFVGEANVERLSLTTIPVGALTAAVVLFALKQSIARRGDRAAAPTLRASIALLPLVAWLVWLGAFRDLAMHGLADVQGALAAVACASSVALWLCGSEIALALASASVAAVGASFAGFATAHFTAVTLVIVAVALGSRGGHARWVALAVASIAFAYAEWTARRTRPEHAGVEASRALADGLRWIRSNASSGGAWNHPLAVAEWRVAIDPELGPALAYHARRAPVAARVPGELRPAAADAIEAAFYDEDDRAAERAAIALEDLDAPFVVLGAAVQPRWLEVELSRSATGRARRMPAAHELGGEFRLPWTAVYASPESGDWLHDRSGASAASVVIHATRADAPTRSTPRMRAQ